VVVVGLLSPADDKDFESKRLPKLFVGEGEDELNVVGGGEVSWLLRLLGVDEILQDPELEFCDERSGFSGITGLIVVTLLLTILLLVVVVVVIVVGESVDFSIFCHFSEIDLKSFLPLGMVGFVFLLWETSVLDFSIIFSIFLSTTSLALVIIFGTDVVADVDGGNSGWLVCGSINLLFAVPMLLTEVILLEYFFSNKDHRSLVSVPLLLEVSLLNGLCGLLLLLLFC
jgi:hypothetical protein